MWKFLTKRRLAERGGGGELRLADIEGAPSVLFSVFSRYGDSIISFRIINEFIGKYPEKRYVVVTSNQAYPYAVELIKNGNAEVFGVNKRKDVLKLIRLVGRLRRERIALGFNPWSYGEDSEYFITFAERFFTYKKFSKHPKEYNLYDRVREYLCLDRPEASGKRPSLGDKSRIIVAPFSTDATKSLSADGLKILLAEIRKKYPKAVITAAVQENEIEKAGSGAEVFVFGKSLKKSEEFLKLLKSSDLFIGVDAGPLHLADAVGVDSVGIFGPTAPETVLDRGSRIIPARLSALKGIFCFAADCKDPICLRKVFDAGLFGNITDTDIDRKIALEKDKCVL